MVLRLRGDSDLQHSQEKGRDPSGGRRGSDANAAGCVPHRPGRQFCREELPLPLSLTVFALQVAIVGTKGKFSHEETLAWVENAWPSLGLDSRFV